MGFFTANELIRKTRQKVSVENMQPDCLKCNLWKGCKTKKMKVSGEGRKKILIIGDVPTIEDDEYGSHFVGENGQVLKTALKKIDIFMNKDCWKVNAVNCRTPRDRPPSHKEIKCCYPYVKQTIKKLKPKLIVLLGPIAITSLLGEDFSNRKITTWRAYEIPDEKFNCFIFPMFHPSQIVNSGIDLNLQSSFDRDINRIDHCLKRTFVAPKNYEKYVTSLTTFEGVTNLLKRILKRKCKIAFDYETTGLKPYREGHKIVTIGLAVSAKKAFAFPFNYKTYWTDKEFKVIKNLWKKILSDKKIKKIAQNSKFEEIWSRVLIGARPRWHWDTLMAEHIMDNRRGSTGLKFQTYVRYGIRPYDKIINPYLKSKNGEFNTVEQAPFKELLMYNGLDCIYCWMRYKDQTDYLPKMKDMFKAYKFFMQGLRTMGTIQYNGISVDTEYFDKTKEELAERIINTKEELLSGKESQKFKEKYGRQLNITSNPDLGKLFFDVLGKPPVYTPKGNYKTDKGTLESLDLPFVDKLLEMKRLEKAKGTYLAQFSRESYKEKMHPFFDLHIPVSYRGSSSMPNFQNLPKRDPEIGNLIRKGIVPSKNCVIIESDFSGAEVITSASYHLDSQFIHDITEGDMHRDLATELFLLPSDMLADAKKKGGDAWDKSGKKIRFFGKNNWTFAQFYGDWFGSCGKLLWENVVESGMLLPDLKTSVKKWLKTQDIFELGEIEEDGPTPGSFLEHCKEVETRMWEERFPDYTQWKKDVVEGYQRWGYVETYLGFRFQGYMDRKQCTNYPIQGTSFHLLVYSLNKVEQFLAKHKLKTKLIGQIHDSIILDAHKEEITFVTQGIEKIVGSLQNTFKWLAVPLEMEYELSDLREDGGNFANMKELSLKEINKLY